jgi:hypothetical protein
MQGVPVDGREDQGDWGPPLDQHLTSFRVHSATLLHHGVPFLDEFTEFRPAAFEGYFRSTSLSKPNTTARAALSSSRSISNSPKVRVSGWPRTYRSRRRGRSLGGEAPG